MFRHSIKLENIDISSFNIINLEDMSSMFYGFSSLKPVEVII